MLKKLRAIMCRRRGYHRESCTITAFPGVDLVEHFHQCEECGAVTFARLQKPDVVPAYARVPMGLSVEGQRDYIN